MAKVRADQLLVDRALVESRTRAQAVIVAGLVFSDTRRIDKPGQLLPADAPLSVRGRDHPWVSRGGLKLDHALATFGIDVAGLVAIDVGSSTGGFTDVLLRRGARRVTALDVGCGQLHPSLRRDPRVASLESTDIRALDAETLGEAPALVAIDVSFIGLHLVLPAAVPLLAPGGALVALIKPQFEVGRAHVGRGGIVRDEAVQARACAEVGDALAALGLSVRAPISSPVEGGDGNREFLIGARLG